MLDLIEQYTRQIKVLEHRLSEIPQTPENVHRIKTLEFEIYELIHDIEEMKGN